MLTFEQTDFYEQNGYLMVEDVITKDQLNKLQDITYDFIESSRQVTENDDVFDLDEGHSAETPRLTRIKLPHKQNKYFPGSRVPIVSKNMLQKFKPDYIVILPCNLKDEIIEQLFIHDLQSFDENNSLSAPSISTFINT